jgi:hypothetical protein
VHVLLYRLEIAIFLSSLHPLFPFVFVVQSLAKLLGSSTRVCEMLDVMDELECAYTPPIPVQPTPLVANALAPLEMQHVDIVTPNGTCLAADVSVSVAPGEV